MCSASVVLTRLFAGRVCLSNDLSDHDLSGTHQPVCDLIGALSTVSVRRPSAGPLPVPRRRAESPERVVGGVDTHRDNHVGDY